MALYQPRVTRNGKTTISKIWWYSYSDQGKRVRVSTGCTDKSSAYSFIANLRKKVARQRAGIHDPYEAHANTPLLDHLDEFRDDILANGSQKQRAQNVYARVLKVVKGTKAHYIRDIDPVKVMKFLHDLRSTKTRMHRPLSAQTYNFYLQAVKQFSRWLKDKRRAIDNPLVGLKRVNVAIDRRHDRRALSDEEVSKLLTATLESGVNVEDYQPNIRHMIYFIALNTGLRKSEIAELTPANFVLNIPNPKYKLAAHQVKNQEAAEILLLPRIIEPLRGFLKGKQLNEPLFPFLEDRKGSKMMKLDLKRAGIPYVVDGLYADFHALRHTFITNLVRWGMSLHEVRIFARHADIKMTLRYFHSDLDQQAEALRKLE